MNKTAIITFCYKNYNYGGVLQAYALQNYLRGIGCENEIMKLDLAACAGYRTEHPAPEKPAARPARAGKLARTARGLAHLPRTIRRRWRRAKRRYYRTFLARRAESFDAFIRDRIATSAPVYSDENIEAANGEYDCFVVGSDQVWNPWLGCHTTFLRFARDDCRKIAYAASIGADTVEEDYLDYMIPWINRFDAVSVREKAAQTLLAGAVEPQVVHVMDPVFLLSREEWLGLCASQSAVKGDYALLYLLGDAKENYEAAERAARKLHVRLVAIPFGSMYPEDAGMDLRAQKVLTAGPDEFLALVRDAKYVITDSFHCTAFSMIFRKRLCVLMRREDHSDHRMNSRLESLLEMAGMRDRCAAPRVEDVVDALRRPIDYEAVAARLRRETDKSKAFLREALGR